MSALNWSLVALSALVLLIALIVGHFFPRARLWKWADPIYYPLVVVSVILLFISNERGRTIDDLRRENSRVTRALLELESAKPTIGAQNLGFKLLGSSYQLLIAEVELGNACAISADISCGPPRDNGKIVSSIFKDFKPPSSLEDNANTAMQVNEFCKRGFQTIDALAAREGIASSVFGRLKIHYSDLSQKNLAPMDFAVTNKDEAAFREEIRNQLANVIARVPESYRETIQKLWDSNANYAGNLHNALSLCLRIPQREIENLKTMERWNEEHAGFIAAQVDISAKINEARREQEPTALQMIVAFIIGQLWPFILVLGLSFKFAKGVAGLRT